MGLINFSKADSRPALYLVSKIKRNGLNFTSLITQNIEWAEILPAYHSVTQTQPTKMNTKRHLKYLFYVL